MPQSQRARHLPVRYHADGKLGCGYGSGLWQYTGRHQRKQLDILQAAASTRARAADSVLDHSAKAIELEDIEARVSELERAAETAKQHSQR
jgi:hypothetical protein